MRYNIFFNSLGCPITEALIHSKRLFHRFLSYVFNLQISEKENEPMLRLKPVEFYKESSKQLELYLNHFRRSVSEIE